MPLVKGTRSKLYTNSSTPRPPFITDVEKLHHALLRSEQEVLKMREQMEFLAFLVRRAWQGDQNAMSDVAAIVGIKDEGKPHKLMNFSDTGSEIGCESERWASMVEGLLRAERERDAEQSSTVKLVEREVMLEQQLDNHTPVFSSYLNKPRGNFNQKISARVKSASSARVKSAGPVRRPPSSQGSYAMSEVPSVPVSTPRGPASRPVSAPHKSTTPTSSVSVHGSELLIAHNPNSKKPGRCSTCPGSDECTCPIMRSTNEELWRATPRFGIPTSANFWTDEGNLKFGNEILKEKDQMMVAILCASGK